jgi:hypothetical protein
VRRQAGIRPLKESIATLVLSCPLCVPAALGAPRESFEAGSGGWAAHPPATVATAMAANGAPAGAITEGEACLKLSSDSGGKWSQLAVNKRLLPAIRGADTLSLGLHVPAGVLPTDGWAKVQVRPFGGKGDTAAFDLTKGIELALGKVGGKTDHLEWNYAAEGGVDPECLWAHVALVKVASGGTMSPLYIDNVRFRKTQADKAMRSTDAFLLGDEWELVWNDEFNGSKGSPPADHWRAGAKWQKDGTWRDATLSRKEAYHDGKENLVMRTRYHGGKRLAPYLVTSEKGTYTKAQSILFGPGENGTFIEWRANVSQFRAHAAWFALWLFSDHPYTGDPAKGSEIDVMEYVPFGNDVYTPMNKFNTAIHLRDDGTASVSPPKPNGHTVFDENQWHTWGLHWTRDLQVFYLDGKPY